MKIQVVHCHPLTESFDHALFEAIVETLHGNGHEVIATDLYREGFQPAMTESERRSYMSNDYDLSKVAGEWYVRFYTRTYGLKHTILRYADVYGEIGRASCRERV